MSQDPQTGTRIRTRRRSVCHRHPNEPVTGLCALCLRDRLTYLDSSSSSTAQLEVKHENIMSFPLSRRTRGHPIPELRRSKSVAVEKCEVLNSDQRRKSCDVRASRTLTDLFDLDDTKKLGFLSVTEPVLEIFEDHNDNNNNHDHDDCTEIRVPKIRDLTMRASNDAFIRNEVYDNDGEDLRTMKEHIEMELQNKKRTLWNSALVFGQKLRKWRQKNKRNDRSKLVKPEVVECGLGRRSCDTAPRFSVDANRIDEHRASLDGYMIARTIPTLRPMLPIINDDIMVPPINKGIMVKEYLSSSSAKSNSDSSLLNTGSSSSSMKSSSSKTGNDAIGQETKLVITERELKDWHLRSINATNVKSSRTIAVKNSNGNNREMSSSWTKMSNLLWTSKKNGDCVQESNASNGVEIGDLSGMFVRNSSYVGSIELLHPRVEEGGRHSTSDVDSGLLRLHLSPFRNRKS